MSNEVALVTISYIIIISLFLIAAFASLMGLVKNQKTYLFLIIPVVIYEAFRIIILLQYYGKIENDLFFSYIGVRMALFAGVLMAVILTIIQGRSYNKTLKFVPAKNPPPPDA